MPEKVLHEREDKLNYIFLPRVRHSIPALCSSLFTPDITMFPTRSTTLLLCVLSPISSASRRPSAFAPTARAGIPMLNRQYRGGRRKTSSGKSN